MRSQRHKKLFWRYVFCKELTRIDTESYRMSLRKAWLRGEMNTWKRLRMLMTFYWRHPNNLGTGKVVFELVTDKEAGVNRRKVFFSPKSPKKMEEDTMEETVASTDGVLDTTEKTVAGNDGVLHKEVKCYSCQDIRHYLVQCPKSVSQSDKNGFKLSQHENSICKSWVLIDTCSTHSMTNNHALVKSIRRCDKNKNLVLTTNGRDKEFFWIAELKMLPLTVHFDEGSPATILSFKDVANILGVSIWIDTKKERAFFCRDWSWWHVQIYSMSFRSLLLQHK